MPTVMRRFRMHARRNSHRAGSFRCGRRCHARPAFAAELHGGRVLGAGTADICIGFTRRRERSARAGAAASPPRRGCRGARSRPAWWGRWLRIAGRSAHGRQSDAITDASRDVHRVSRERVPSVPAPNRRRVRPQAGQAGALSSTLSPGSERRVRDVMSQRVDGRPARQRNVFVAEPEQYGRAVGVRRASHLGGEPGLGRCPARPPAGPAGAGLPSREGSTPLPAQPVSAPRPESPSAGVAASRGGQGNPRGGRKRLPCDLNRRQPARTALSNARAPTEAKAWPLPREITRTTSATRICPGAAAAHSRAASITGRP